MSRKVYQVQFMDTRDNSQHVMTASLRSGYTGLGDIPRMVATMGRRSDMPVASSATWNHSGDPEADYLITSLTLKN